MQQLTEFSSLIVGGALNENFEVSPLYTPFGRSTLGEYVYQVGGSQYPLGRKLGVPFHNPVIVLILTQSNLPPSYPTTRVYLEGHHGVSLCTHIPYTWGYMMELDSSMHKAARGHILEVIWTPNYTLLPTERFFSYCTVG